MDACDEKCSMLGHWVKDYINNSKQDIKFNDMVQQILIDYAKIADIPGVRRAIMEALHRANVLNQLPYDKQHGIYVYNRDKQTHTS